MSLPRASPVPLRPQGNRESGIRPGSSPMSGNSRPFPVLQTRNKTIHRSSTAPQTVGTPITAKDASNATATGFTGTVTFGGTGGFTGTSATFTAGVLSGVSVTPMTAGSGLTFTVTDIGSGKTGSATITTIQTQYAFWSGGANFDDDANNDGVDNGLAFLLGASSPTATVSLPTVTHSSGNLVMTFNMLNAANRGLHRSKFNKAMTLASRTHGWNPQPFPTSPV